MGSCGVSELQCVGVLVCGSCRVWELSGTNTNNKNDVLFLIYKFKTMLHLNGVGALKCGCIEVWVCYSVCALQCAGIDTWRSCKYGRVEVWKSCSVGVFRRVAA